MPWSLRKFSSQNIRLLGLDITSSKVKLLELLSLNDQYHIKQFGQQALPAGIIEGSHVQEMDALSDVIQQLLIELGYRAKPAPVLDVIIAVPDVCTISKTIAVSDRLDDRDLEALVQIELDKFIPQAKEEVYFDFKRLGTSIAQSSLKEVLIVATRIHHINQRVAALKRLGVLVRVVDIESFAVQRALPLILDGHNDEGMTLLLDLGAHYLKFFFFKQKLLIFIREEELSYVNVEDRRHSFERYCEEVLTRIKRNYQFFYSAHSHKILITQIFLAGGGATYQDLQTFLHRQLGIPIKIANPFTKMTVAEHLPLQHLMHDAPMYITACGLAQRVC